MIIPITATNQVLKTAQGDKYAMLYAHKMIHEPGIKKTATRLPFMSSSSLKAMDLSACYAQVEYFIQY